MKLFPPIVVTMLAYIGFACTAFLTVCFLHDYAWLPLRDWWCSWRDAYQRWRKEQQHPFLKCERVGHVLEDRTIWILSYEWDGPYTTQYHHYCCARCSPKKIGKPIVRSPLFRVSD